MATVLAVLTSGRRHGYTASLLDAAAAGAQSVRGVQVRFLHTHAFRYGPCTSCFSCIRDRRHVCCLDDDFGREGKGEVFQEVARANGLILADPVHNWSPSASARLFVERCYPFLWSGWLNGMAAATISCASNQGMQLLARRELCKWLFGFRMRYVGGVAAHVAALEEAKAEARRLGREVGRLAVREVTEGRQPWSDPDCFIHYATYAPWSALEPYIENLTQGLMRIEGSIISHALQTGAFTRRDAQDLARAADAELARAISLYHVGDVPGACKCLVAANAMWTRATWLQFLQDHVVGAPQPSAYPPLPDTSPPP